MTQQKKESRSNPSSTPLHSVWNWSLSAFDSQNWVKNVFAKTRHTRYPIKLLRYWFIYNLIREEQIRLGRPLRVCEVGVDRGQMLRFMRDAGFADIACWVAVDCSLQPELRESCYTRQIEANVDLPDFCLDEEYDVIVVLHLLEHLFEPERVVHRLSAALVPGGVMVGGFPVTPKWLESFWQKRIRLTASKFGHISVFSPQRVRNMAKSCELYLDFISGAFFLRNSGSFIENFKGWLRLNLLFGALFQSLGGEIYWRMRKSIALETCARNMGQSTDMSSRGDR
ncbi:MAG: class I SAM-dependent methyltransferase [Burkholderiales bacterium]